MEIPAKAIEAAARRLYADECRAVDEVRKERGLRRKKHLEFDHLNSLKADTYREKARPPLEAGGPHIAAGPLRGTASGAGGLTEHRRRLIDLDRERSQVVEARNKMIREDYANGSTIADLSQSTGLTRTMLYKIINKESPDA